MRGLVLQFEVTRHNHEHRGRRTNSVCFMDAPNVLGLLETGWRILTDTCLCKAMFPEVVQSLRDQHLAFEREVVRRAQALDLEAWQWGAEPGPSAAAAAGTPHNTGAMGPASSNATAAGVVDMATEDSTTKGSPLEDLSVGATATEDALGDSGVLGALATVSSVAKAVSDDATRVVREALAYDRAAPPCVTAAEQGPPPPLPPRRPQPQQPIRLMPAVTTMPYSCKNDLPQKIDLEFSGGAPFQEQWFENKEECDDFLASFVNYGPHGDQVNWPYLMDTINGHCQHSVNRHRTEDPEEVRNTWEPYVALAMDWWYQNNDSKSLRKNVSHLGGYIADYMNTELCCRSGRWIKHYEVVYNAFYKEAFVARRDTILQYDKSNNIGRFLETGPNSEKIGDCFEVAFVIMLSMCQFDCMWDLVELIMFYTNHADETNADRRAFALSLTRKSRAWRPVIVDVPVQKQAYGDTGNEVLTEQALQEVADLHEKLTAVQATEPTWQSPSDQQRGAGLQAGATSSVTAGPGIEADGSGPSQPLAAQEDSSAAAGSSIKASRKGPSQPLAAQEDWFDHDDEPNAQLRNAKSTMARIQQQPRAVPHPFLREWAPSAYKKTEAFRGSEMCLAIQRTLRSRMFYEVHGDPDDVVEDSGHKCALAHAACPREGQPWLTRMASASIAAMQELQGTPMRGETVQAHRERQAKAREYCAALLQDIPDVIFEHWGVAGFDRDAGVEEKYRKLMNLCQGHKGETIEILLYGSDWLLVDGPCPKMPLTRKEAQKCTDFRNAQFMCGHLSNDWDAWYRARATGQPLAALSFQTKDAQGMQRHSLTTPEHRRGMRTWRFAMDWEEEPDWEYQTHRFFVPCRGNVQKHWARETLVTTLGLLFRHLGDQYTATDLYMYYCSCRLTSVKFQKGALATTGHMLRRATTWSLQGTGEEILADYLERQNLPRPAAGGRAICEWMSRARMALHRAVIQEYQMPWGRQRGSRVPGNVVSNFEWQLASATLLWWPLELAARICPPVVAKLRAEMGDAYPEQLQGLVAQPEYSCVATVFVDLTTREQVPLEDVDQVAGCLRADSPSFARQGKDRHYVPLPCGERCRMDPSITTERCGWLCPRHAHDRNHQPLAVAVDEETRVATRQLLVWPVIGNAIARAAVMRTDTPKAKLFVAKPPLDWRWQDRSAPVLRPNPMKEMTAHLRPDEHRIGDMLVLQYTIRESDYVWRTASRYDPAAKWWADQMDQDL